MLERISTPGLAIYTYLIVDPLTNQGVVIDATRDVDPILQKIQKTGTSIIALLETHVHADFLSGSKELKHQLASSPPIFCSGLGGAKWVPNYTDKLVEDFFTIHLGSISLQAWHTPGHTPEHIMWVIYNQNHDSKTPISALTGDFLFVGSIGRPDLLGQNSLSALSDQLYQSVFQTLPQLPGFLEIYPAHGSGSVCGKDIDPAPSSTLTKERQTNPFLQIQEKDLWIKFILDNLPPPPNYFSHMKQLNLQGPALLDTLKSIEEYPLKNINPAQPLNALMIDLRSKEEFAEKHIAKSLNIPLTASFINWAPIVIPYQAEVHLIANDKMTVEQAVKTLQIVGIDLVHFYTIFDSEALLSLSLKTSFYSVFTPQELQHRLLQNNQDFLLIDVRTPNEWQEGHIQEAKNVSLNTFSETLHQLPKDKSIIVICKSGYRGSIAASMLKKEGYAEVSNIQGGMQEWVQLQLPITKIHKTVNIDFP